MISNTETSAINQPQGISVLPRAIVTINGTQVYIKRIEVNTAQFGYADTFRVTLPLGQQSPQINRAFFAANPKVTVSIYIGFPPDPNNFTTADLDLITTGISDRYSDDLGENCIEIEGRDLTAKFIDTQISQVFPNQTSSQIVTTFAQKQGLTPQVTPTKTPVGTFSYTQQTVLGNQMSEWDLMVALAQNEGFVVFVQGSTLIFEPRPAPGQNSYVIDYTPATTSNPIPLANVSSLQVITNSSVASDTQVVVRVPYDPKTGNGYTAKAQMTTHSGKPTAVKKYVYRRPGLTPQQASQLAQQVLAQHTSQGRGISFSLAGDNLLKKDSIVQLKGTDGYDGYYYPDEINRTLQLEGEDGYSMYVYARNNIQDAESAPDSGGNAA